MLQFGVSLTDDIRSVNYDCNTFIIQATGDKKIVRFFNFLFCFPLKTFSIITEKDSVQDAYGTVVSFC